VPARRALQRTTAGLRSRLQRLTPFTVALQSAPFRALEAAAKRNTRRLNAAQSLPCLPPVQLRLNCSTLRLLQNKQIAFTRAKFVG
jgi:hypothetical protein